VAQRGSKNNTDWTKDLYKKVSAIAKTNRAKKTWVQKKEKRMIHLGNLLSAKTVRGSKRKKGPSIGTWGSKRTGKRKKKILDKGLRNCKKREKKKKIKKIPETPRTSLGN